METIYDMKDRHVKELVSRAIPFLNEKPQVFEVELDYGGVLGTSIVPYEVSVENGHLRIVDMETDCVFDEDDATYNTLFDIVVGILKKNKVLE